MNILKITLNEDGDIVNYVQDFIILRGGYGDITMQVEVPCSLLLDSVTDLDGNGVSTGNNVKVGAIVRTATGENIKTRSYEFKWVKNFKIKDIDYALYQRPMPKEFTLWETVSYLEEATTGTLEMVFNVSNWTTNEAGTKIEENRALHIVAADVHPSTNLDESEKIDNPSDLEILQSQVQTLNNSLDNVEKDLYGDDESKFGEYLSKRLVAGNKMSITKDTSGVPNGLKISLIPMKANEVSIEPIKDMASNNVQDALDELSKRTDAEHVDTISAVEDNMIDNSDPYNPKILHDPSKTDNVTYLAKTEQIDDTLLALRKDISTETTKRTSADTNLQAQIESNTNNIATNTSDIASLKSSKLDASKANTKVMTELGITATNDNVTLNKSYKNLSTQVTSSNSTTMPLANDTTAGLMSKADYAQIRSNTARIEQIEGQTSRLAYTAGDDPTATQIEQFVKDSGYTDTSLWSSLAIYVLGTNHIWRYYTNTDTWTDIGVDTVNQFTNSIAGIIKGSATAGKVYAETDGTGSVYGWDNLNTKVSNNASAISTEATDRTNEDTALSNRINDLNTKFTNNTSAISTETTNRVSADTALSNRINNDATPHTAASITLTVAGWSNKSQTVTITGYDDSKLNTVVPDLASAVNWANYGINASAENSNGITFTCAIVPIVALTFKVISETIIQTSNGGSSSGIDTGTSSI